MAMAGYLNGPGIAASKIGWGDVQVMCVSDSIEKHENPRIISCPTPPTILTSSIKRKNNVHMELSNSLPSPTAEAHRCTTHIPTAETRRYIHIHNNCIHRMAFVLPSATSAFRHRNTIDDLTSTCTVTQPISLNYSFQCNDSHHSKGQRAEQSVH